MSARFFKIVLLVDNLLLILLTILGIALSILLIGPQLITEFSVALGVLSFSYVVTGFFFVMASFCFIGIVYSHLVCLHFTAALILCAPLALSVWLVVKEFLYSSQINYYIVGVSIIYGILWFVQVICELCLGCYICCRPESLDEVDKEKGEMKKLGNEDGTEEEKEKLVLTGNEPIPPKRTTTLEGVKEEENEPNPEEEDDIPEEDEQDYRDNLSPGDRLGLRGTGFHDHDVRPIDEDAEISPSPPGGKPGHPTELPLETIPEERQRLLA
ncbi:uncharacterized protein LOC128389691 isoform X2 [Panonychus citri]|nr:uncharacterized protein LOC128389691 isoform X2 [Panonychus citri]